MPENTEIVDLEERNQDQDRANRSIEIRDSSGYQLIRVRSRRQLRAPDRLGYADILAYALVVMEDGENKPLTYVEL